MVAARLACEIVLLTVSVLTGAAKVKPTFGCSLEAVTRRPAPGTVVGTSVEEDAPPIELVEDVVVATAAVKPAAKDEVEGMFIVWFMFMSNTAFKTSAVHGVRLPSCFTIFTSLNLIRS